MAEKQIRSCPNCKSGMICEEEKNYHYTESGLEDVYIDDINVFKCECGEQIVSIPAMPELHNLIAKNLIKKPALLNSNEIRFLRKNMGLTATKLAEYLGVDIASISRWENDSQSISKAHDRLIRVIYCELNDIPHEEAKGLIQNEFIKINPDKKDAQILRIKPWMWAKDSVSCYVR
jgi:putative zinc finger/helix-turn-helix YgiT family protein